MTFNKLYNNLINENLKFIIKKISNYYLYEI